MINNEQESMTSEDEGGGMFPQRGISSKKGVSHGPLLNGTSLNTSNGTSSCVVMTNGHSTSMFDFGFDEENELDSSW